jgi:hypothetical protein
MPGEERVHAGVVVELGQTAQVALENGQVAGPGSSKVPSVQQREQAALLDLGVPFLRRVVEQPPRPDAADDS